ncbi:MAG: MIP family channel protein [Clostridiales bacterium]|nr:MIP family channel protein [Clostridiales bacterium]
MRKYFSEFLGTLVLVLFACGTAAVTGAKLLGSAAGAAYLLTALAFGLVVVAMAYSIGQVSGAHINPAVSLGMLLSGRMSAKDFVLYVIAQFLGATAGAAVLYWIIGDGLGLGQNALYLGDAFKSLVIEVILTFVFVLTILGVTSKRGNPAQAGLVIGLTLTLVHILGIYFTGTSVNPARSFGPALILSLVGQPEALSVVWVFILAPLMGGALAAAVWQALDREEGALKA